MATLQIPMATILNLAVDLGAIRQDTSHKAVLAAQHIALSINGKDPAEGRTMVVLNEKSCFSRYFHRLTPSLLSGWTGF